MLLSARAAGLALALHTACEAPGAPDAGPDGGRDAGVDAGRDAGPDAGPPPSRDAGVDAGRDGGPNDPGWVRLSGLPDACAVERATHPERVFRMEWEPCPGMAGCLREATTTLSTGWEVGWYDPVEEVGYFYGIIGPEPRRVTMLMSTRGAPVAAFRDPPRVSGDGISCQVRWGVGQGHGAALLKYYDESLGANPRRQWIYFGALDELASVDEPLAALDYPVSPQAMEVSRDLVALEYQPGGLVVAVDRTGADTLLAGTEVRGSAQQISIVGGEVFWEDWADLTRLAQAPFGGTATIVHRADPGDVKGMDGHEDGIAWIQGYDRPAGEDYRRIELWTSPPPSGERLLAPRMVTSLPQRGSATQGGGWYAVSVGGPRRVEVIRLEDGTRRQWVPPDGWGISREPFYIAEHEMLIRGGADGRGFLLRIDPHTLPLVE